MPNQAGTITSARGVITLDGSPNDTITLTPTAGSYTVEYPFGTVAISASSATQTLALTNGGQLRVLCISGSVAYALTDAADSLSLSQAQVAATQALVSPDGNLVLGSTSAATANTTAAQAWLDVLDAAGGGRFAINSPGIVYINSTLSVGDNTTIELGNGTTMRLAPGANCNMLRTKNWGSAAIAVTSITSADGITATATTTSPHGQTVGTSKWMFIYGAAPETYNGTRLVTFTGASAYTYRVARVAPTTALTTPATGTIVCRLGNGNITLIGGAWDYDTANQSTPDTWQRHAIYLRRIANLRMLRMSVLNTPKYAIHVANFQGFEASGLDFDTASDGLHLGGSGKQSRVVGLRGKTGDDLYAVTQGDYPQYHDSGYIIGNFDQLACDDVDIDGALDAVKLCPQGGYTWGETVVTNVRGRFSGGGAMILPQFDPGIVQQNGATGCTIGTINSLKLDKIDSQQSSANPLVSVTCIVNSLTYSNLTATLGTTVNTSCALVVGNGATVNKLQGVNWTITGGSVNAAGVVVNNGGTLGEFDLSNFALDTLSGAVKFLPSSFSTGPLNFSNGKGNAMSGFVYTGVRGTGSVPIPVLCTNVSYTAATGAFLVGVGSPAQISARFANCAVLASNVLTGTWLNVTAEHTPELTQNITYAATITPDYASGQVKTCTFTAAMTVAAPTNVFSGNGQAARTLTFILIRNSVGAAAITWNAAYVFPTVYVDNTVNTTRTTVVFRYDDNGKWVCVSGANTWQ